MKHRVTLSLPREVAERADALVSELGLPSRSALYERALKTLLKQVQDQKVEKSLDAYYGTRPDEELSEERDMVAAFNRSQRRLDLDDEGA